MMLSVGGQPHGGEGDTEFHGLFYPDGDRITRHMAERLQTEPFYQHDKFDEAMRAVPKNRRRVAIDCGAWVGGWSKNLEALFDHVVAIEANPNNARCVRRNVSSSTDVLNIAVGDENGTISMGPHDGGGNVGSFGRGEGEIQLCRIDDVPEIQKLRNVDYMKVHVNGMELKALRGAQKTIHHHKPVLTVVLKAAIEDQGDSEDEARALLTKIGYRYAGGKKPYGIWVPA